MQRADRDVDPPLCFVTFPVKLEQHLQAALSSLSLAY